jgi:hypothetical protein
LRRNSLRSSSMRATIRSRAALMPLTKGTGEELAKRVSAGAASCAKREAAYLEWRMVISSKSSTPQRAGVTLGRAGREEFAMDVSGIGQDGLQAARIREDLVQKRAASRGHGLVEIADSSDCDQPSAAAFSPSAAHCCDQSIGRSIRRLTQYPRGSRPSIAARTRVGQRNASDRVLRIQRSVLPSRAASASIV